jgi:general L-amino acid transport system substrate-binding protein
MRWQRALTVGAALTLLMGTVQGGSTLATVKKNGYLRCGVNTGLSGFSVADEKGRWSGIDVDVCRAVAAAALGDAKAVKYTPLTAKERLTALQTGEVDVLSRNTTWTASRDTALGINFAGIDYYDGQGFMVIKALGLKSARELNGASICILSGTTTELNVADYFRTHKMTYQPVVFDTADQTAKGFESGRCDALTSDRSQLYAIRVRLAKPERAMVLPEVISKEPLGPAVRQGDDQWLNIVKWTLFALVSAEEYGVTSANAEALKAKTGNPNVRRLLGTEGDIGPGMGLSNDWAYQAIRQVGNYGEIFERNLGRGSPLGIERGLNALWSEGGLQYAPPIR